MNSQPFTVDFFCVGMAKAGTTTLHDLLALQEGIALPARKETNYFSFGVHGRPNFTGPLDQTSVNDPTITSLDDYQADFGSETAAFRGEVCPSYALPGVAERLHAHNPAARIILLLRDPVGRAFSNYQHLVRDGRERGSFEECLAAEPHRLAEGWEWFWGLKQNSQYADVVSEYVRVFGREQVKIVLFEEFIRDQQHHLQDIMQFIGCDTANIRYEAHDSNKSGVVSDRWKTLHRVLLSEGVVNKTLRALIPAGLRKQLGATFKRLSTTRSDMAPETRAALTAEFHSDVRQLAQLMGDDKRSWIGAYDVS